MIIDYYIDERSVPSTQGFEQRTYNIIDASEVNGSITLRMNARCIEYKHTSVLVDIVQLINSMSSSYVRMNMGKTNSVLIGLEPRLYISYGISLTFYEYSPDKMLIVPNPPLEHLSERESDKIAAGLKERLISDLYHLNDGMANFLKTLLRE